MFDFEIPFRQQEEYLFSVHITQLNQDLDTLNASPQNDVNSTLAYDWMDLDSNAECEVLMPSAVDDELSFASNDSTLCDSPRRRDFTSLHDALLAKSQEKCIIGNLLHEALSLGYKVEIKYRATKETKKGPARDAEIVQVVDADDSARCTWGEHKNCSVSNRAIIKILPGQITLRSYCEDGRDKLYDENGNHVFNPINNPKNNKIRANASKNGLRCFDCSETQGLLQMGSYWYCLIHVSDRKERQEQNLDKHRRIMDEAMQMKNPKEAEAHRMQSSIYCGNKKTSLALIELKRKELDLVRQGHANITPDKTEDEIESLWSRICSQYPMNQLLLGGSFYLAFARIDRSESEPAAFLTERGGTYFSKTRGEMVVAENSRPVLLTEEGRIITNSELIAAGFQVHCLHLERNHLNVAALEKHAQESTLYLPLGRRLHRDYCGGAKVRKDAYHMEFGLYVVFNLNGHSPFIVNH